MMRNNKILKYLANSVLAIIVFASAFASCSDEWDSHYNQVSVTDKSDSYLFDYIKSRDNLTIFTKMLQSVGYDTLLNEPQAFTVWAPDDNALSGIGYGDAALNLKIVKNSIARYSYTTSGVTTLPVPMLNSKYIYLTKADNGYTFDGTPITESNLATNNGILHVTDQYVPYKYNGLEFLNNTVGLDSMRQYVSSMSKVVLDTALSYESGIFVDSIFKTVNPVLNNLAALDVEDSTYTSLFLDNTAWNAAYQKVSSYYKTLPVDGGVAQQRKTSLWTMASTLFYSGEIAIPTSLPRITSTGGYHNYEPNTIFQNAQKSQLSNGWAYLTSEFNIKDTAAWNKTLKVEAESTTYGRSLSNYTAVSQSGVGLSSPISQNSFLELTDGSLNTVAKLYATFPIPYTLSTKYNIYCVFVPRSELDATNLRPYKVKFTVNSINSSGAVTATYANSSNALVSSVGSQATFITNPTKVDTMLVAKNVVLPYSNVVFDNSSTTAFNNNIKFSLKVENATAKTTAEQAIYSRNLMIDCIILEPVEE
jgi:Fasciclin domain